MRARAINSRLVLGATLVTLGVLFLVDSLTDSNVFGDYWPVLLIGWGLWTWYAQQWRVSIPPLVLIVVGGLLLAGNITDDYDVWQFWPVIIIVIGLALIMRRAVPMSSAGHVGATADGAVTITDVFGGGERRHSGIFRGGQVTAVFGGGTLDLLEATLPDEGATMDVTCLFGGYEIRVPDNREIDLRVTAILGGTEDKRTRRQAEESAGRLTVTGTAMFGGFTVKN